MATVEWHQRKHIEHSDRDVERREQAEGAGPAVEAADVVADLRGPDDCSRSRRHVVVRADQVAEHVDRIDHLRHTGDGLSHADNEVLRSLGERVDQTELNAVLRVGRYAKVAGHLTNHVGVLNEGGLDRQWLAIALHRQGASGAGRCCGENFAEPVCGRHRLTVDGHDDVVDE